MSSEPEPGLMPEHLRPDPGESITLTVDGHDFRVWTPTPGAYHFDWLSGPHEYGFGLSTSGGAALSLPEMTEAIRDFLAEIDPATGYLTE